MRVAVLASGVGTNLQALLDTVHGRDGIEVVAVASDKPAAMALERARSAGVEAQAFPAEAFDDRVVRDQAMGDWLAARDVELVVLAGYMQLLTGAFLGRFPGRVINVHPALLPAFPGLHAVEQALEKNKAADITQGEQLLGIIVLSDGRDNVGRTTVDVRAYEQFVSMMKAFR